MKFSIANTFVDSLERLSNNEKNVTKRKVFDLQVNPANPGMQSHRVANGLDRNFWSMRVNDDIRIIVHKIGMEMMACYVDHHDAAYRWAKRRKMVTTPHPCVTKIVEIREKVEENSVPPKIESQEINSPEILSENRLFKNVLDETLLSYGVPEKLLDRIRKANENNFLEIACNLNENTVVALLDLAFGGIHMINDVEELERTIKWMTEEELECSLRSIGKACFVNHYEIFSNFKMSNSELVQLLMTQQGYTKNASRTRVSKSRRIINADMVVSALINIINSNKVKKEARNKAQKLLNHLKVQ